MTQRPNRPILEIDTLEVAFPDHRGRLRTVVDRVSIGISSGERLGLVGESGSGKSLTALSALGLLPPSARLTNGQIRVGEIDVLAASSATLRQLRGGTIGFVFQEPSAAFNPVFTIGSQITETIRTHRTVSRAAARQECLRLLAQADITDPDTVAAAYPQQLSGGQLQRAMIAIALAGNPRLLIADEPTTALDLTTQAAILRLLIRISDAEGLGLLLISHDLAVVSSVVHQVVVMFAGQVVERGSAPEVLTEPCHPYTKELLDASFRRLTPPATKPMPRTKGSDSRGCRFAGRCPSVQDDCVITRPSLDRVDAGRWCRCPFAVREDRHGP